MAVQVVDAKIDETFQEIAWNLGGQVTKCDHREYGSAKIKINKVGGKGSVDALFKSLGDEMQVHPDFLPRVRRETSLSLRQVWMSHGDQLSEPPKDFNIIGYTQSAPYAALAHSSRPLYGIQFHPEVTHSPQGKEVIGSFILNICQCRPHWTMVLFFCSLI